MNPDKMNVTELKALAYDIFANIQIGQKELVAVNDLIRKKQPMKGDKKCQKQTTNQG